MTPHSDMHHHPATCRTRTTDAPALQKANVLVAFLFTILGSSVMAQVAPNLIQDSGFEGFGVVPGATLPQSTYGVWTTSGSTWLYGLPTSSQLPYEGNAAIFIGDQYNPNAIEQTFSTTIGSRYRLSFALNGNPWVSTAQVTVVGSGGTDLNLICAAPPTPHEWGECSYTFTASSALSTLRFQNATGGSSVDAVRCSELVPEIELAYSSSLIIAWDDLGSGGNMDGRFWWPLIPAAQPTYRRLGAIARADYSAPAGMTIAKDLSGSAFASPISYTFAWADGGSGANLNACFYVPVAPPGYRVLGHAMRSCGWTNPPPLSHIVCVRADLCCPGTVGNLIYNDSGTGANTNFSAWDIVAPPGAIDIDGFVGHASHAAYPGPVWCLRADAVAQVPAPTQTELDTLIQTHGPIVHMHPNDVLMPDDPAAILDHPQTTVIGETLVNPGVFGSFSETIHNTGLTSSTTILDDIQTALSHPNASLASYLMRLDYPMALKFGDLSRAKAYVRAQPLDGVITELQFWIFYPYNGAGKAYASVSPWWSQTWNPTGSMGEHFSDWEVIRVRLTNRDLYNPNTYKMLSVSMGRHDFEVEFSVGNAALTLQSGHPVIFSADRSHAQYTQPGYLTYKTVYTSILLGLATLRTDLFDLSGAGPALNAHTDYQIVSSAWPSIVTDTPDWFFFGGQWGGFSSNSVSSTATIGPLGLYTHNEQEVNNGKPGLLRRNEFNVSVPINANLGRLGSSVGTLTPAFDQHTLNYSMTVPATSSSIDLQPLAMDHNAVIGVMMNG
ncbi:MAG: hypothetical protein ACI85K_002837, partial [Hyphomicrobiaceae bacterium]